MDDTLLLTIFITLGILVLLVPVFIIFLKFAKMGDKQAISKSKFNDIRVGMTESELYSQFGEPQQVIEADETTKVVTYHENRFAMLFLLYVGIEAQVSVKDGVVTNVVISAKK